MIKRLDAQIERVGREILAVALLRTTPGIGPCRGLLISTEALPIERFPTPEKLVGYAGLAPHSSRSGLRPTRYGRQSSSAAALARQMGVLASDRSGESPQFYADLVRGRTVLRQAVESEYVVLDQDGSSRRATLIELFDIQSSPELPD